MRAGTMSVAGFRSWRSCPIGGSIGHGRAPDLELAAAGVHPRRDHPLPIIDHAAARAPSLEAFTQINAEGLKLAAADLDRCF